VELKELVNVVWAIMEPIELCDEEYIRKKNFGHVVAAKI